MDAVTSRIGLDDLHPRRGDHAAEQHVTEHQDADHHHRDLVVDADQRLHQHAAADHLRGEVERRDGDRRQRADRPRRLGIVAIGEDVGQRVLADVAAGLGDHQQHGDVRNQPAHRIHEAVVAVERDQAGDAEERRRRKVVAGDRPAVLQARHAAARDVEVGRGLDALRGDVGDVHRHRDDRAEHDEGEPAEPLGRRRPAASAGVAKAASAMALAASAERRALISCLPWPSRRRGRSPPPSDRTRRSRAWRSNTRAPRRR